MTTHVTIALNGTKGSTAIIADPLNTAAGFVTVSFGTAVAAARGQSTGPMLTAVKAMIRAMAEGLVAPAATEAVSVPLYATTSGAVLLADANNVLTDSLAITNGVGATNFQKTVQSRLRSIDALRAFIEFKL